LETYWKQLSIVNSFPTLHRPHVAVIIGLKGWGSGFKKGQCVVMSAGSFFFLNDQPTRKDEKILQMTSEWRNWFRWGDNFGS
jgi:hypothetical protein